MTRDVSLLIMIGGALLVMVLYWEQPIVISDQQNPPAISEPTVAEMIETTFIAVGDVSFSRNVAAQIDRANDPLLPFAQIGQLLESADFTVANLESPISGKNSYPPTGSLIFNAPPAFTAGLKKYRVQVVNLANNHILDQGIAGLTYTQQYLSKQGIQTIGSGVNLTEAWQPAIVEAPGVKIAFIGASYASLNDGGKGDNDNVARIHDLDNLQKSISSARLLADVTVVIMHAGIEYTRTPTSAQINFAHRAIDSGADLVIGHHPHWIQTIEKYQGKYIFYSLGNFIFDQMWSQETREGLLLVVNVKKTIGENAKVSSIKLVPVIIDNYSTPRPTSPSESARILKTLGLSVDTLEPDY